MPHFKVNGSPTNAPLGLHMNLLAKFINGISYMMKIAIQENSATAWERYKQAPGPGATLLGWPTSIY